MMVFSAGGLGANTIEMAIGARRRGLPVVAVTSLAQSNAVEPTTRRARASTTTPTSSSTCARRRPTPSSPIDGLESPVGPGSSIAAIAVVNEIKVQTAERARRARA